MDIWTYESVEYVTVAGEAWLASASEYPRSIQALWRERPWAATVLPCGRVFDVVSLPGLPGRRVLEELWTTGPGCGPAASYRGRLLLFARPGTAERLSPLLRWEEWGPGTPAALCHGAGDAVTVPPLQRMVDAPDSPGLGSGRWIVAPDQREPWLPDAGVLLRACMRAARRTARERMLPARGENRFQSEGADC
ncbi:bifunctional DNA primase/polymerase [Streptacidiphilus sp. ASG 303]|uniref:bifunctional DNA primase/polymerase n=1 Tax=Streptacidiphilus sp. ASG 303 TaxID=2896847 RepID=UPI001E28E837|nr:bifunctional DNA primase/polymerase [Streptacidiphilus sp. ASG 303]MCD0483318.1 bifunctional DNA primase/polymerase [Streptacidiphilus sp. ASG 303]